MKKFNWLYWLLFITAILVIIFACDKDTTEPENQDFP